MVESWPHVPVLLAPALAHLAVRPGGTYVDATVGAGGHSAAIAQRLAGGRLIALDRDPAALAVARARLAPAVESLESVTFFHRNYCALAAVLAEAGAGAVDGVLIDAGCSSLQIDTAARGFSFQRPGPLDMRMDPTTGPTAAELLRTTPEATVADWLRRYGDVRPAGRIARELVQRARAGRLATTADLAEAVQAALPFVRGTPDEVRTVFQALRMVVNDELAALEAGVAAAIDALRPGGRLVVIAFHSGEDRVVKQALQAAARTQRTHLPDGRTAHETPPRMRLLTRRPVTPDAAEVMRNPRAASAKLRAAERLANAQADE